MSIACIVIGYVCLVGTLGPVGLILVAAHLAVMTACTGAMRSTRPPRK